MKILYLEDDDLVSRCVRDLLAEENWQVDTCKNASEAREKVESHEFYDHILLDNVLSRAYAAESQYCVSTPAPQLRSDPISGIDIARDARSLPHRCFIPVIIFIASQCEEDAYKAGADLFLRKPEDLAVLVEKISQICRT